MNYMNVNNEVFADLMNNMREKAGHVPCVCKIQQARLSVPTQRRKTFKATLTVEIEESAFVNPSQILRNFGGFVVLGIAPENLQEDYR